MTDKEKQEWLEVKYPLTIIPDRYDGTYSGGGWLAFPLYCDEVPPAVDGYDEACAAFWKDYSEPVGKGNNAQSAIDNLVSQMKGKVIIDVPFGAQDSELKGWEYTIPEGMEAIIQDGKVVVRQKESEDERIRKEMIKAISEIEPDKTYLRLSQEEKDAWIAYLEKQKKPHYTKRNALFDKCVKNCDPKVMKEVSDKVDEMLGKEQKPSINIDQLKSLMLQYLQEAANEKDDSDIEADTDKWARKILGYDFEQKPAEWNEQDEKVYDYLKGGFEYATGSPDLLKSTLWGKSDATIQDYRNFIDKLKILRPQPKPAEWREDFGKEVESVHKRYPEVSFAKLTRIAYHFAKWADKYKSTEWSEEDEKIRKTLLDYYEKALDNYTCVEWLNGITYGELCDWLKSLHPQPHWKPSEKEITAFENMLKGEFPDGIFPGVTLSELLAKLKKLYYNESIPSWKPSKEQIRALKYAVDKWEKGQGVACPSSFKYYLIKELYEQLKKL